MSLVALALFNWSDLAFGSKKPLKELKAIFVAAPREISPARFKELVKTYLPQGNIVLGIAKEPFIDGFEGQPQFKTLQRSTIQSIIDQVNAASKTNRISVLEYFQRELPYILEKIPFERAVFINGSWKHVFHVSPAYYTLAKAKTPYELVSPFTSEQEAREYEQRTDAEIIQNLSSSDWSGELDEAALLAAATQSAARSYDYSFQTGLALAKRVSSSKAKYKLLLSTFNRVVPFQTYAMLHGASRETHFSPPNDLNHYDAVHAEVELLVAAQKTGTSLEGTTLFINLMPCPSCTRMFCETDIEEFVYSIDHSDGYAITMLTAAGKKVRRVVA